MRTVARQLTEAMMQFTKAYELCGHDAHACRELVLENAEVALKAILAANGIVLP
jgi:hypothetical protein